jgi:hypothetical protein
VLAQQTALTFEATDRSLRQVQLIRADLGTALAMPGADAAWRRPLPSWQSINQFRIE